MQVIRNARIVTATEQFAGTLALDGNTIAAIDCGASSIAAAQDWDGDYLLPGLVELHTDNLEKHMMPRPKVNWPALPAIIAHDAQVAAAGITTVLDAISVGDMDSSGVRSDMLGPCLAGLRQADNAGLLRADHYLHLRLELADENLLDMFEPCLEDDRLRLVSLMDHTPGQRQWSDISHYRTYVTGKRGWSEEKVDSMLTELLQRQSLFVDAHRAAVIDCCTRRAIPVPLASHDDTTVTHVTEGVEDGVSISEFPTTMVAAHAARRHGLGIIMGAPNMVRGGSHSGNVSAAELARAGLLDALSSDYVPASLLHAAFLLQSEGFSLPKAIATVSHNPAQMVGLTDRGEIAPGLRADFLRVRVVKGIPVVMQAWKAGKQIV